MKSLKLCGYQGQIIILVTQAFGILRPLTKVRGVVVKQVPLIVKKKSAVRNVAVLSKLNIWNLLEYDQIIYYDSDVIFLKDPTSVYENCPISNQSICAVSDRTRSTGDVYFNSGFMVIHPNRKTFDHLISILHIADKDDNYIDQDFLNTVFKFEWNSLDTTYNLQHVTKDDEKDLSTFIAIHEKLDNLRRIFPDKRYVWNNLQSDTSKKIFRRNDSVIIEGWKIISNLKI